MMQTLLQPNSWSCLPTCVAMIMDVEPRLIIEQIGHDGSDKIWPELPDPHSRRSFHLQEIIDVLVEHLIVPVLIEAKPMMLPCDVQTGEPLITEQAEISVWADPESRLSKYLENHLAILLGVHVDNQNSSHAVAWDREICHDPRGSRYSIENFIMHGALVLF